MRLGCAFTMNHSTKGSSSAVTHLRVFGFKLTRKFLLQGNAKVHDSVEIHFSFDVFGR